MITIEDKGRQIHNKHSDSEEDEKTKEQNKIDEKN